MKKKLIYAACLLFIVVLIAVGYVYSIASTGFDIDKTVYIYIDKNRDYNKVLQEVQDSAKVKSIKNFEKLSSYMKYKDNIKTGRYAVSREMSIRDLIVNLRSGHQSPVKLKFNNIRTKDDLEIRISSQLMMSKEDLSEVLNDPIKCGEMGFTPQTIVAMFIPNTYETYWDVKTDAFIQRMYKEFKNFWTEERLAKANKIGLSPIEVSTLASIVEEECTYSNEYPIVAGLYLNRIHRSQLLQADPTVKFAVGDFSLRRVLNKHLAVDSPYNTYKYAGLPPGPIRIPSIKGLDAVLNHADHDYFYMCAKEDFSGYHNFATTLADHNRNADKYRAALNQKNIY